ncbi:MAG: ribonuclease Y [Firmicutes bacterium]|nr:ribonuclease Y [Bacillota bacterium]
MLNANLFAATIPSWLGALLSVLALAVGAVIGIVVFRIIQNKKIGATKQSADKILADALLKSQSAHKEAQLKAQEEVHKLRQEFDKEKSQAERDLKERRGELSQSEQRIRHKEEALDKKEEAYEKKLEGIETARTALKTREEEIAQKQIEVGQAHSRMVAEIEKAASLTKEQAKAELIKVIESDAKIEAAKLVRDIETQAKDEADKKAKEIVTAAIQRCAVDHSSEITVSVVALPNDEMKGRIIGREGRNIRALENATGIDLIIDDTPESIVLSGFDPVRREVARITLEKLISDGRIHPTRIEEVVEKTRRELDQQMKEAGEAAMFEAGVFGLNAEVVKLLGRLKYRTSYGQNVLKHSLEVSHLAGLMAMELGADIALAKRGGLLHDLGKAVDHEVEGTHVSIGADLAKKYKESAEVVHCIAAHHNDIEPTTIEAVLVQCADAISGSKPGARRESLDNYVKRLEKLEGIANGFNGVEKSFAIQAGREVRIIVKPEIVNEAAMLFLAKDIAKQIEKDMEYPGQIKVNVIRETRSIEFAK